MPKAFNKSLYNKIVETIREAKKPIWINEIKRIVSNKENRTISQGLITYYIYKYLKDKLIFYKDYAKRKIPVITKVKFKNNA